MNEQPATAPKLPGWQVLAVLVGMPALYFVNCVMPWSYGLFVKQDHGYFLPLLASILVLHWASVALAIWFLRRSGGRLSDIGFDFTPLTFALFVAIIGLVGIGFVYLRQTWPAEANPSETWQLFYPWTRRERMLGILLYFSAGFCEEFVFRGWAIRILQARGFRTWQAVALATTSFVFIHSLGALILFPMLIFFGLLFSLLFLWTKRLSPCMYIHAILDMTMILAV